MNLGIRICARIRACQSDTEKKYTTQASVS
jgi:hypothetical protein